jgi:transcriptional regulator with XRE-family HTH domain
VEVVAVSAVEMGRRLEDHRTAARLTKRELSQVSGVSTSWIRRLEAGERAGRRETLEALAVGLVSVEPDLGHAASIAQELVELAGEDLVIDELSDERREHRVRRRAARALPASEVLMRRDARLLEEQLRAARVAPDDEALLSLARHLVGDQLVTGHVRDVGSQVPNVGLVTDDPERL